MQHLRQFAVSALFGLATVSAMAEQQTPSSAQGEWSANVGVVSQYIYRGVEEDDNPALQAGVEYAHQSGLFAGYWGSTLNYDSSDETQSHGFEHDFYIGYGRELNDDWSYSSQIVTYYYQDGGTVYNEDRSEKRRTTGVELLNDISYKDLTFGLGVMLSDVNYANAGDVYLSLAYSHPLPYDISLNTSVGGSIYHDHRDDSFVETSDSFVFNEARVGLSKTIFDRADLTLDYIHGREARDASDHKEHVVVGVNFNF